MSTKKDNFFKVIGLTDKNKDGKVDFQDALQLLGKSDSDKKPFPTKEVIGGVAVLGAALYLYQRSKGDRKGRRRNRR